MPTQVSDEQDKLVRELTQLQKSDESEISLENRYLNIGLLIAIVISTIMLALSQQSILSISILAIGFFSVLSLITSFIGMKFSKLIIAFSVFLFSLLAIYILYFIEPLVPELIIFIYCLGLFSFAAQYKLKGFIFGSIIFLITEIYFSILSGFSVEKLYSIIITILLVEIIGIIPILYYEITKVKKETRLQQIRLQILAMQNQDLVNSWQEYFTRKPS